MRVRILIAVAAVSAFTLPNARGAEHVTLRNGFDVQCNHHAQVDGRIRLFLSAGEDNYIEFAQDDIAAVDRVPDPPAQPESAAASAASIYAANALPNSLPNSLPGSPTGPRKSLVPDSYPTLSPADLHQILAKAGSEHNLDEDLLASVVKAESGGNVRAVSRTGARGLMQLMPGTANELGVKDSFAPDQNVHGGAAYLDALLTRYHDNMALALAAYNAGPLAVDRYHGIPPYHETQAYVARVIHEFNRRVHAREALAKHAIASSTLPVQPSR
jgi:soluble lytic murein transglycosylase-like protein